MTEQKNNENKENENVKKPIVYTIGNVKVLEWENTIDGDKKVKNYTVEKFFKNKDDKFQSAKTFNFSEIQLLVKCIDEMVRSKRPLKVENK